MKKARHKPNHGLQRTAPAGTLAAPPPSPAQPSLQPPPSQSFGSLEKYKQPFHSTQRNEHDRWNATATGFFPALEARLCFEQYLGACLSPTVFRESEFRFFFFSREESRMHIHVSHPDGEAKFWLRPSIELARNIGLSSSKIKDAERIVKSHQQEITDAWNNHFGG